MAGSCWLLSQRAPPRSASVYSPFAVNLGRCMKTGDTLYNLYSRVCVPGKTEGLNLSVFDNITGINESTALTKHL